MISMAYAAALLHIFQIIAANNYRVKGDGILNQPSVPPASDEKCSDENDKDETENSDSREHEARSYFVLQKGCIRNGGGG